ncbi:hypothetical protein BSNK01_00120 [Bacillaceae bacterium]
MVTFRYHFITVMAVFLALGVGILVGGSIGQQWLNEKQQALLQRLERRYTEAVKSNEQMQGQLADLTKKIEQTNQEFVSILTQKYAPELKDKNVLLWFEGTEPPLALQGMLQSVGMRVFQPQDVRKMPALPDLILYFSGERPTLSSPIVVIGENPPKWIDELTNDWVQFSNEPSSFIEQWQLLQTIQLLIKGSEYIENGKRS